MAMILDAFMSKFCTLLTDAVYEEVIMVLGVQDELQKLLQKMKSIQFLLKDAEKRKINEESPINNWLSELKDVMYDADDIIDLCRIEGAQLRADQNYRSEPSPVCCNFSSTFSSCFTSVPLRHGIGKRIKELNDRLSLIDENRKQFKLEKSEIFEPPQITRVNPRQTSALVDHLAGGVEVEAATNELVNLLIGGKLEEKCRLFAVTGMGGIGKTTLAQKILNHPKVKTYFHLNVWVCISQTYSETEVLKQVIRGVKGNYGDAKTKSELQLILRDSIVSGQNFFLVLDDVWRADVWVDLFRAPLRETNTCVLVTTRYENVAKVMKPACIHNVMKLSLESSWDMLHKLLFWEGEEQPTNDLKELGFNIVERCGGLPLAIKAIAGVLDTKERSRKEWEKILRSDVWSISNLHEDHVAALHLSYEDLPSHLKQCFLYFSLFPEDANLYHHDLIHLWVAEGFVAERQGLFMEDLADEHLKELFKRNLLLPNHDFPFRKAYKMHDLFRSLALYLSKEETSFGDVNVRNSTPSRKLRRLSTVNKEAGSTEILDSVAIQGALRTLFASGSDLLLDDERLRRLLSLRVLDISGTHIEKLPDSIGNLLHLRYLDLNSTNITAIPESIKYLAYLQFLNIYNCNNLTQLPNGITQLHNLRCLNMLGTAISFMPKGIKNMKQLNELIGFVEANNNSISSKLEDLSSMKQLRRLDICLSKDIQIGANILKELPNLLYLVVRFPYIGSEANMEEQQAVEKLLDELIPPHSLEELTIEDFFGHRYPNWMALASFENYVPNLTKLYLYSMSSCTELPPLGQLPNLKEVTISGASNVKKIGPEFLGGGVNSTTRIAFPKLETLEIDGMDLLEDWTFDAEVEENTSPKLKLLPCLRKLDINYCPCLKQLPKGLKHSAMKSLHLFSNPSLKSLDDLPVKMVELKIIDCEALEKVCCLPMLKVLRVESCKSLSCVGKLDALQELEYQDTNRESLPEWLLMLLQQRVLQNDANANFLLEMECTKEVLQECVKGGSYWDLIQHIPRVIAFGDFKFYLKYNKHPFAYNTNLRLVQTIDIL